MRKLHLFLCLSVCLSFLSMPSYSQFNYGYYGEDQNTVDAGKLITHNPNEKILAILESNPKDTARYDFSITVTDENGVYITDVSYLNMSKSIGQYLKLEPNNFIYLPASNGYIITGNATMGGRKPQDPTYRTVFSMHLDAGLSASMFYVYTGWPFFTSDDIYNKELRTQSAALYTINGKEEVIMYTQMTPLQRPETAEIGLLQIDAVGLPFAMHRVDMPTAYGGRLRNFQTSSIDVGDKETRILATGWVNPSTMNTPFILDFEINAQTGFPAAGGNLNHYQQANLHYVGNTQYYITNPAQRNDFIYFTYSHLTPNGNTSCQMNMYDAVKLLALDKTTLTPQFVREITVPCYTKNVFRPYIFGHQNNEMIRLGFTQHEIRNGRMAALAYETNITSSLPPHLYRYNFREGNDYAFRSGMTYDNQSFGENMTLINFTDYSGNLKTHLVGATSATLKSYCTEEVKVEDPRERTPHSTQIARIVRTENRFEKFEPKHNKPLNPDTKCASYRPEASNSIAEMNTESAFSIFPNPVSNNQITIHGNMQQGDQIAIMNAAGQLIYQQTLKDGQKTRLELPQSLATGVYMIQISHNNTVRHTDKLYILK